MYFLNVMIFGPKLTTYKLTDPIKTIDSFFPTSVMVKQSTQN